MSVRGKLFTAMAVVVVIISWAYVQLTQDYLRYVLHNYTLAQLAEQFMDYYEQNGYSWEGIAQAGIPADFTPSEARRGGLVVADPDKQPILQLGSDDAGFIMRSKYRQSLTVGDVQAGYLYVRNWEPPHMQEFRFYLVHAMLKGSIAVKAFSGTVAFFVGLWLVRKFTLPLQRLIPAIDKVTHNEYDISLPVTTKDEFGKLTEAFNYMTKRLLNAEKLRKQLTADVAHELRTPLAIIQSKLEAIQESGKPVKPEILLPLQDEVIRMSRLIGDVHNLSLAEARLLQLDKQQADLVQLARRAIELVELEAEKEELGLALETDAADTIVEVDQDRIMQVMYNLLSNSIRYTGRGGRIMVRIRNTLSDQGDTLVALEVADTGIGIPNEELPYVFNRFHRVEDARSRHSGGMGIGLAIAKEFVELHGGFVAVDSETGAGTTFTVYLPAASQHGP